MLWVIVFYFISNYGDCTTLGTLEGLRATINCGFSLSRVEAPFWIINGTVYELFSIPRHFPFIPVVNSYSSLTIPYTYLELDNMTFQCAAFSDNGLANGTQIRLTVFPSVRERNDFENLTVKELMLNYQDLHTQENTTTLSWVLSDTCSEKFQVQGYTLDTGEPVQTPNHTFDVGNSTPFTITDIDLSYKLVALSKTQTVCPSTRNIYYRFDEISIIEESVLNSSICFVIPETHVCSRSLNFVWPSRAEGRSCVCPVHNSSAGRWVFESCVEGCRDAILTPTLTKEGEVCIFDEISSSMMFHFVCSTEPCGDRNPCFLQTLIGSLAILNVKRDITSTFYNTQTSQTTAASCMNETTSGFKVTASTPASETAGTSEDVPLFIISVATLLCFVILLVVLICTILCCWHSKRKHNRLLPVQSTAQQHIQDSNLYDISMVTPPKSNEVEDVTFPLYDNIPDKEDAPTLANAKTQISAEGLYDDVVNLLHAPAHDAQTNTPVATNEAQTNSSMTNTTGTPAPFTPASCLYEDIESLQTQALELYDQVSNGASSTTYSSLSHFKHKTKNAKCHAVNDMYSTLQISKEPERSCEGTTVVYSVVDKTKKKKHKSVASHAFNTSAEPTAANISPQHS